MYSCRRIDSNINIFSNIFANKFFLAIFLICVLGQVIIVQFGGPAFQVVPLDGAHWGIALVIGFISLPIGVVIRLIPDDIFGFLFVNEATREKYLGSNAAEPTVYSGNKRSNTMRSQDSKQHKSQSIATSSICSVE